MLNFNNLQRTFFLFLIFFIMQSSYADAQEQKKAGIDEQLGKYIPLESEFYTEDGRLVKLKEIINKPTILTLVFYECRGICTPLLTELAENVNKIDFKLGKDYQIVTISFDPDEKPNLAKGKKANYIKLLNNKPADGDWVFLTSDSANIYSITNTVGFYFFKEEDQFVHPGALIFISPDGKITRYLLGIKFLPFDIKMAIIEAGEGKVGPTIAKFLKFCYTYDVEGKTYALNVTRVAALITIALAGIFVLFLIIKPKKNNLEVRS